MNIIDRSIRLAHSVESTTIVDWVSWLDCSVENVAVEQRIFASVRSTIWSSVETGILRPTADHTRVGREKYIIRQCLYFVLLSFNWAFFSLIRFILERCRNQADPSTVLLGQLTQIAYDMKIHRPYRLDYSLQLLSLRSLW